MSMLSGHHLDDVSNRLSTLIQKAKKAVDDSKPMQERKKLLKIKMEDTKVKNDLAKV